jgi:hypothetical protein
MDDIIWNKVGKTRIKVKKSGNEFHFMIGGFVAYRLIMQNRIRSWNKYRVPMKQGVEIYTSFPRWAYQLMSVHDAMAWLHSIGVEDMSFYLEECEKRGWEL